VDDRAFREGLDRHLTTEPEEIPLDEESPAVIEARETAEAAAEAIRTLCHLTLPANGYPGLEFPSDVDVIVAHLETMVQRLPQLCQQLGGWLVREREAGRAGVDAPHLDAGLTVARARVCLKSAADAVPAVERQLHWARNATTHLTGEGRP